MSDVKVSAAEFKELDKLFSAWSSLKRLGWSEPQYFHFPEGEFELIELGSTGIHRAIRHHEMCWVDYEWPSTPFLVREIRNSGAAGGNRQEPQK